MRPLFVFDNIRPARRTLLFTVAGVRVEATRFAWAAPIIWLTVGMSLAVVDGMGGAAASIVGRAAQYGVVLYATNALHSLGHFLAGKLVAAPMDVLVLTSTRDVTLYLADPSLLPPSVRIGRSVGGPAANVTIALIGFGLTAYVAAPWLQLFAAVNLAIGLWTLSPIPTMDGWVIWRLLLRRVRG